MAYSKRRSERELGSSQHSLARAKSYKLSAKSHQLTEGARGLRMTREVKEGERGMPGCQEPKKDAVHCEKRRGVVCGRRAGGVRMGKPVL